MGNPPQNQGKNKLHGITQKINMQDDFIQAIEAEGLTAPKKIIGDGEIHRFDSDNTRKKKGSYVFHPNEPQSGWFKCWKTGVERTWRNGYSETDPEKREQHQKIIKQRNQERNGRILTLNKLAAKKASEEYNRAIPAKPDHPYLINKKIQPVDRLKQDHHSGNLIVPIYFRDGNMISRQTISKDGAKYFLEYGQTKGGYFDLGVSQEKIIICEGFATGTSIYEAIGNRVRCAFNCWNLKEVAINTREEYPKAHIIIAADDDHKTKGNPGHTKATEAALSINNASVVSPDFGETRPEKATDFNDLHCLKGLEAVRMLFETILKPNYTSDANSKLNLPSNKLITESDLWNKLEEIKSTLLPVIPLEDKLLPEPFRAWLTDVSNRMQCPVDYPTATVIVSCSILIGTRCSIRPKGNDTWQVVPNLWGGIVGQPSALKTPAIQEATRMLDKLENNANKMFENNSKDYQRELRTWEMKKKILEDELKHALKNKQNDSVVIDEIESRLHGHEDNPPDEPTLKRYSTSDPTVPKLQELMSSNPHGLFLIRDELNGFLMSLEMEGRESDRAFHIEAWNGQGSFTSDRIGRGTTHCELVCESVFGSIQPARIIPHIRQTINGSANDGLIQRFQVLVYPDNSEWVYVDQSPDNDAEKRAFKLIQKLNDLDFVKDAGAVLEDGDKFPYLHFDSDAQLLFKEWITELEGKLSSLDETPTIQEHLGKYRSLMPSLALIFHLLDVADGKAFGPVSLSSAQLAAEWCDYLESHARRIYNMAGNITERAVVVIAEKIKQGILEDGFTARSVYRNGWSHLTEKEVVISALIDLVEYGWLQSKKNTPRNGGKKTDVYFINPKIKIIQIPKSMN